MRGKGIWLTVLTLSLLGLGGWLGVGAEWRALLMNLPTDSDVLFWDQSQRDATFRMMDRLPVLAKSRRTTTGPLRELPTGEPLRLDLDVDELMAQQRHAALLVLHKGKIRLERYGLDFRSDGRWTSFSVAKSFTSTLVGIAIAEGHIESTEASVADYIPGLVGSAYEAVSVGQLLTMSSGIAWNEDYEDPESDVARFNHQAPEGGHSAIVSYMRKLPRAHEPGTVWNYSTGETNLIGVLVSSATGQNLTDYLSAKIWQRVGMQQFGTWILGPDGHEISGCCIQAAPRDYARFGQYMLEQGVIDGVPTLPAGWLSAATNKQIGYGREGQGYGYQWWTYDDGSYAARGIFGQGIFINPERQLVIVSNSSWGAARGAQGQGQQREAFYQAVLSAIDRESVALR